MFLQGEKQYTLVKDYQRKNGINLFAQRRLINISRRCTWRLSIGDYYFPQS
jgi:hypothetical protein